MRKLSKNNNTEILIRDLFKKGTFGENFPETQFKLKAALYLEDILNSIEDPFSTIGPKNSTAKIANDLYINLLRELSPETIIPLYEFCKLGKIPSGQCKSISSSLLELHKWLTKNDPLFPEFKLFT